MKKKLIIASFLLSSAIVFGQSEFVGKFTITQTPKIKLGSDVKYYSSTITCATSGSNGRVFAIGELIASGRSSKTGGTEIDWVDRLRKMEDNCLNISSLQKGQGGIEITLGFSMWDWKKREESKTPHTITAENRRLYTYNYSYNIEERLIIRNKGKIILDTLLGKITDTKFYDYSEKKETIMGGDKSITAFDYENKQIFPRVRSILAEKFETREVTIGIEAEEFNKKDPLELNIETKKLILSLHNKSYSEISNVEIGNIIKVYEQFLSESSENKKDKINPKVTRQLQYNTAIAYFLIGDFNKAKYLLSLDEKNTKPKSSVFSGFSSKFDFITKSFSNNGSLESLVNSANNKYRLVDNGYDLFKLIKYYENVLVKK